MTIFRSDLHSTVQLKDLTVVSFGPNEPDAVMFEIYYRDEVLLATLANFADGSRHLYFDFVKDGVPGREIIDFGGEHFQLFSDELRSKISELKKEIDEWDEGLRGVGNIWDPKILANPNLSYNFQTKLYEEHDETRTS